LYPDKVIFEISHLIKVEIRSLGWVSSLAIGAKGATQMVVLNFFEIQIYYKNGG
jgi:hypothetical protein